MGNRLLINMESRILGDGYVRFGGEYMGTWYLKKCQSTVCLAYGAGKTLIMCTAAYEMKRLGLANKPMIIGLKTNVFDIADTFRKAYPNAKLLYPGKDDFTKQNRQRIFNDIKNNDWDCIILTHEQFGMKEKTLKLLFYLKRGTQSKEGKSPIMARLSVGRTMVQFSCKIACSP